MIDYLEIDPRIRVRNGPDLLRCDRIVHVNSFNEQSAKQFKDEFLDAHETGQEIIPIVIDSFGGQVYSLLAMVDLIKSSDKIVSTIVMGKAMSCGAVLLTCGHEGYRFAAPTSTVMIHDVSSMAWGKVEDLKVSVAECERLNKLIFGIMEKNCGLEKGALLNQLRMKNNSADWFLTPQQAKKNNVVNQIKVPKLITTVSVKTKLV
jgi:ATP-dependent Clp protease protease subunit